MYLVTKAGEIRNSLEHPGDFIQSGAGGSTRDDCVFLTNNRRDAEECADRISAGAGTAGKEKTRKRDKKRNR